MSTFYTMKAAPRRVSLTGFLILVAVLIAVAAFSGPLLDLIHRWNKQEEYSHGYFIPIITLLLLWTRRNALRSSIGRPSWTGPFLVLIAIAMHVIGELSAIFILSQVGFVILLLGIVLGIGGYSLLRVTFVPIVFLLFAIPLPYFIDAKLTLQLQFMSSEFGAFFIRMAGIPVYLDGNIIDMGNYQLQVVEACSGLRYLYPLLSLGFLAAYLFHAPFWQRALVFLSSIPIAIGMNGLRIGLVGILVAQWGNEMAEGTLHAFQGWVIFLACAILLAGEIYVLALISGKSFSDIFYFPKPLIKPAPTISTKSKIMGPLAACLLVLCAGGISGFLVSNRAEIIPERSRFAEFPSRMEEWRGHTSMLDRDTERFLHVDDYLLSDYSRRDGRMVNLYVAYYASQRDGESPHSPIVCIPGGGWAITSLQRSSYRNGDQERPFNRVTIEKGRTKQLVYYWFEERGRTITNEYLAKVYLLTDAIAKNRTDGALVRLTTTVLPGELERDADRRLQEFMHDAVPVLSNFLPGDNSQSRRSASSAPSVHPL